MLVYMMWSSVVVYDDMISRESRIVCDNYTTEWTRGYSIGLENGVVLDGSKRYKMLPGELCEIEYRKGKS